MFSSFPFGLEPLRSCLRERTTSRSGSRLSMPGIGTGSRYSRVARRRRFLLDMDCWITAGARGRAIRGSTRGRKMNTVYNVFAGQSLDRLAALSDGLFAIAMTLLVLNLGVPLSQGINNDRDLWLTLVGLAPHLVSYV